jgi:hypothetical protein
MFTVTLWSTTDVYLQFTSLSVYGELIHKMHDTLKEKKKTNATSGSTKYRNLLPKEYIWRDEIRDCEENPNFQLKFQAHSINIRLTITQNSPR